MHLLYYLKTKTKFCSCLFNRDSQYRILRWSIYFTLAHVHVWVGLPIVRQESRRRRRRHHHHHHHHHHHPLVAPASKAMNSTNQYNYMYDLSAVCVWPFSLPIHVMRSLVSWKPSGQVQ